MVNIGAGRGPATHSVPRTLHILAHFIHSTTWEAATMVTLPFCRWGKWVTEGLRNSCLAPQLMGGSINMWDVKWLWSPHFLIQGAGQLVTMTRCQKCYECYDTVSVLDAWGQQRRVSWVRGCQQRFLRDGPWAEFWWGGGGRCAQQEEHVKRCWGGESRASVLQCGRDRERQMGGSKMWLERGTRPRSWRMLGTMLRGPDCHLRAAETVKRVTLTTAWRT